MSHTIFWLYLHARGLENVDSWVGVAGYFFSASVLVIKIIQTKFIIPEEIFPVVGVSILRTKYGTGRNLSANEALAAPNIFLELWSSQLLLSFNISHHKDESRQKLAFQQDDSIHMTNEMVENCANSICNSRQFENVDDPSKDAPGTQWNRSPNVVSCNRRLRRR